MVAVAYIRRSHSGESEVSEQTQRETVARLAAEDGLPIEHVYMDWGRSGGGGRDRTGRRRVERRVEYLAMLARIGAGEVETVYTYDQDRLARDMGLYASLMELAEDFDVRIVTGSMGDITSEWNRVGADYRSVAASHELRKITKRNRATIRMCQERGDDFGQPPLGYVKRRDPVGRVEIAKVDPGAISRVADAYREAGTFLGAAKLLNQRDVPPSFAARVRRDGRPWGGDRYSGAIWHPSTVRKVLAREAPELVPPGVRRGTHGPGRARLFAGLLRCWCGGIMTPSGGRTGKLVYACGRGFRDPRHPRPHSVSERKLLPWMQAEAARLRVPFDEAELGPVAGEEGRDLAAERERATRLFVRGTISEEVLDAMLAELDAEAEREARRGAVLDIPGAVDWTQDAGVVNTMLRALFVRVDLGPDLLPVSAEWKVPEWRAPEPGLTT